MSKSQDGPHAEDSGVKQAMMSPGCDPEEIFRRNESILDEHHKKLALWCEDPAEALCALLVYHDRKATVALDASSVERYDNKQALGRALQWLLEPQTAISMSLRVPKKKVVKLAVEFLDFAEQYVHIADFYKMQSRGLATFSIHEQGRVIRFHSAPGAGRETAIDGQISGIEAQRIAVQADESITFDKQHVRAFRKMGPRAVQGFVQISRFPSQAFADVRSMLDAITPPEPVPIHPDTDLGGFLVRELADVVAALRIWSLACLNFSANATILCMSTQFVDAEFLHRKITDATMLNFRTVRAVIEHLTYHPGKSSDPLLHPLILCGNHLVWSLNVMLYYRCERNALRIMLKTPHLRKSADTIIGHRASSLEHCLLELFQRRGYTGKTQTKIASSREKGEIDLLAYTKRCPNEVLIVEAKAGLAPDEIKEVYNSSESLKQGQDQLSKCVRILNGASEKELATWFPFVNWSEVSVKHLLIVSSDAEPDTHLDPMVAPAISLPVLQSLLSEDDFHSPSSVVAACRERRWLDGLIEEEQEESHVRICVGDIAYDLPVSYTHQ